MPNRNKFYLVLIALCFLVYANSLNNAFVSDDIPAILENPQISQFSRFWLVPHTLLNSFNYLIAKHNPFIYHLTSIILHSIVTILVFFLLRLFFKTEASFLAACLFAVHPIHAEVVTWISGRHYIITALFILSGYFLYNSATDFAKTGKELNLKLYLSCLIIFAYYIYTYFSFYFLFPFLLILSDVTFKRWRRNWRCWIPFIIVVTAALILKEGAVVQRISAGRKMIDIHLSSMKNPFVYFVYIIYSLYSHFWLLVWPAKLVFFHELIIPKILYNYGVFYLIPIALLLFFTFKKAKNLFFALSIFILFLAPTYSPVPIASLVAERYLYFPSIALSIFIAFIYEKCTTKYEKSKIYLLIIVILIITAYGIRTILRNEDWKTPEIFWMKTVAVSPTSVLARNEMGLIYLGKGDIDKAIEEYKKAIEINPNYARLYNNRGIAYQHKGSLDQSMSDYSKAIQINPSYSDAYMNRAVVYLNTGNLNQAISDYNKVIQINPKFVTAYNNLGLAYDKLGDKEKAISFLKKAIEIDPKLATIYYNLGTIYNNLGNKKEAIAFYDKVIKIDHKCVDAYNNLASIYIDIGKNKEAILLLKKALEINPRYALAHFNLSSAYFKEKEYSLAVKHCDEALKLGYNVPGEFLESLQPYRGK